MSGSTPKSTRTAIWNDKGDYIEDAETGRKYYIAESTIGVYENNMTSYQPVVQIPTWLWILTGLLLFLSVPTVFCSGAPLAFVAGIASFAAIQEGHFIWTRHSQFS